MCVNGIAGQEGCAGPDIVQASCTGPPCAVWAEWGNFGGCSLSCDGGIQTRTRCEKDYIFYVISSLIRSKFDHFYSTFLAIYYIIYAI